MNGWRGRYWRNTEIEITNSKLQIPNNFQNSPPKADPPLVENIQIVILDIVIYLELVILDFEFLTICP